MKSKDSLRFEIAAQVESFLASGQQIQHATSTDNAGARQPHTLTRQQLLELRKRRDTAHQLPAAITDQDSQPRRWVYRVTWAGGDTGTCASAERIFDCLSHFRRKFGDDRVLAAEERSSDGRWVNSSLLPTCPEEAEGLEGAP